jgi:hypothetical protein
VTTYYRVSAPLGSGKTTAAIEFVGHAARAGQKFVIAQPSIGLINQSVRQFRERWPNIAVTAIHGETTNNVAHEIADHTKNSSGGEVMFITHSALMQCPYWDRRKDWHLIIDEAPQIFYSAESTLPVNYHVLLPALEVHPYNIRYSRLLPGDAPLLDDIAENRGNDQVNALFQDCARKLKSNKWDMFVLNEQFERFQTGKITDGRLLVFGMIDAAIFNGFASVTLMSANLERTIVYRHLVEAGYSFASHSEIEKSLRFTKHENGALLTIHFAVEENWSKRKRNESVKVDDETCSVNDLIVAGAVELFGDDEFVWLVNKDIEGNEPFGGAGAMLPHSPHGLNQFQRIHNAAVLPALNPTPALYGFLDEIAHLNADEVRRAVYHEAVYQAAGRISTRNPADRTPKHLVVADRPAAEMLANLYSGANVVRLPFSSLVPKSGVAGRKRIHDSDAIRKVEHRKRHKTELLGQLDRVNGRSSETKLPYTYKDISSLTDAAFGGSLFYDIHSKHPMMNLDGISSADFIWFLRDLHSRNIAKPDAGLCSPAEFEPKANVSTGRGLSNITAIHGVFLDNDGGDLSPDEFAAMFPHLMMVVHNSSSSTCDLVKWRAIIPSTCTMTIEVHREIMLQIRQALNRRGFFDKKQLEKRAKKGLSGKCHGFDPSKYTASSMFYLPAQAAAGPGASFFLTFDDEKRQAMNPYQWIEKTIINHEPDPTSQPVTTMTPPASVESKDPRLNRVRMLMEADKRANHQERVEMAINRWRSHFKGTGNEKFFMLAVSLAASGLDRADIGRTLQSEAMYAHGSESQRDRRAAIPGILNRLRCAA